MLLDVQEIREAIEYLDKAIQLEPDNGTLLVYRAQARLSNKGGVLHQEFPVISNPHLEDAVTQAIEEMEYALRIDEQCRLAMEVLATLYSQRFVWLGVLFVYAGALRDLRMYCCLLSRMVLSLMHS